MSQLPSRDQYEEQCFVEEQRANSNDEQLSLYVTQAIEAGRIQLAARLVQLISNPDNTDEQLLKAMKAAQFLLLKPQPNLHRDFLDAWVLYQDRKRVKRIKNRMRPKSPFTRRRPR